MPENVITPLQTPGTDTEVQDELTAKVPVEKKTFTQDELDQIVKDRIARERKKYADYPELQKKAAEAEKIKAEKLTEEEKRITRIKELEDIASKKDAEIQARDLREAKRSHIEKLIADKKISLPEGTTVGDFLDILSVTEDGSFDSARLLKIAPGKKGLGSGTQTGHAAIDAPTITEKVNALMKAGKLTEAIALKNSYLKGLHPELWNK
jgi:hypothetical protein